jgi:hypothetical protein
MHHSSNPPSHPLLLDALTKQLSSSDYDVKYFLREIALSKAYQRSSFLPEGFDSDSIPVDSYAVANMKGLSPEQLFESLVVATQSAAILERQIDVVLAEELSETPSDKDANDTAEPDEKELAEARLEKRAEQVAAFVFIFAGVPGQPESEFSASLPQALFLANNETVSQWVPPQLGNLSERLVKLGDAEQIAEELFLCILSRLPTSEERKLVADHLGPAEKQLEQAICELVWSQLASAEFRLNH